MSMRHFLSKLPKQPTSIPSIIPPTILVDVHVSRLWWKMSFEGSDDENPLVNKGVNNKSTEWGTLGSSPSSTTQKLTAQ